MFEFLKLKVQVKENSLIISKGFGFVKPAKVMTNQDFDNQMKECKRAGLSAYVAAAAVWNLPEGVTELKTNIRNLRYFFNGNRPALSLWYVAKYDGETYSELVELLRDSGCFRD